MLAETLSSVKAKDRDLGSVVAKDYRAIRRRRFEYQSPRRPPKARRVASCSPLLCSPPGSVFLAVSGVGRRVACATVLTGDMGQGSILTTQMGDVDSNTLGLAGKGKAIQPSRPDRRLRLVIPAFGKSPTPTSCTMTDRERSSEIGTQSRSRSPRSTRCVIGRALAARSD